MTGVGRLAGFATCVAALTISFCSMRPEPATAGDAPGLIPWPTSIEMGKGLLIMNDKSRVVVADPALLPLAKVLSEEIALLAGIPPGTPEVNEGDKGVARGCIRLTFDRSLKGEAYELVVADGATVRGGAYQAVADGTATLLQLFQPARKGDGGGFRRATVRDEPKYAYRGLMIDVARKEHPASTLEPIVTLCRLYKIPFLHLHLTDNESFRFPSTAYPTLGSKNWSGSAYTLDELKALVKFADDHGVTLIPEIETPGHAGAMGRGMPAEFGGINMDNDALYPALDTLVGELCEVFKSSPYIHIGNDEVWLPGVDQAIKDKEYLKKNNLENSYELWMRHIVRMNEFVRKRGKQTMVWEGFHGDGSAKIKIPKDVLVMPFENTYNPADNLARLGYTLINTAWTPLYVTHGVRCTPAQIYDWNVFSFGRFPHGGYNKVGWVNLQPTPLLIGAQMCAWEQHWWWEIPSLRDRLPAMSERIWNPDLGRTFDDFQKRYAAANHLLDRLILPVRIVATEGLLFKEMNGVEGIPLLPGQPDVYLFRDQLTVEIAPVRPLRPGETIRYSLDGKEPTTNSPAVSGPLTITEKDARLQGVANYPSIREVTLMARLFRGPEPVGQPRVQFYRYDYLCRQPHKARCEVYEVPDGTNRVPADVSALKRVYAGLEPWINLRGMPAVPRPNSLAAGVVWDATLTIPEDGEYEVQLRSQGGTSQLFLDGKAVIDRQASDWGENAAAMTLTGGEHALQVRFCGRGDFETVSIRKAGEKNWRDVNASLKEIK